MKINKIKTNEMHDKFLSKHPIPDEHTMRRHPKVHPHDVLEDLYHAPRSLLSAFRHKTGPDEPQPPLRAESPQMHADVYAQDCWGVTPFEVASANRRRDAMDLLLEG